MTDDRAQLKLELDLDATDQLELPLDGPEDGSPKLDPGELATEAPSDGHEEGIVP
jgi:hypothetical protein